MNIFEKLVIIQTELKAPKDKYNSFGDYKYRSAEGILEAVKPILMKHGATIILTDEIVNVGAKNYVKATAIFLSTDNPEEAPVMTTAYAGEAVEKKKLDNSQLTGVASSYARKYALNGLLLIDDTKDADTDEYQKQTGAEKLVNNDTVKAITDMARLTKTDLAKTLKGKDIQSLTMDQAGRLLKAMKDKANGNEGPAD